MAQWVDSLADYVVSGTTVTGAGRYINSGVSVQVNYRRDMPGADVIVLLRETGGLAFPLVQKEQQAVQVVVDSADLVSGQVTARAIYDSLHDLHAVTIDGHRVLWLRATALPQNIPTGPLAGQNERFQITVNFDALLVLQ